MNAIHEFDGDGRHRICLLQDGKMVAQGTYVTYRSIAHLEYERKTYIAVTAYYQDHIPGLLHETVYSVGEKLDTKVESPTL